MKRLSYGPAGRSIDLYQLGLSREACTRITGVDPIDAQAELLVLSALWGALLGGAALALLLTVWSLA